MSTAHKEAEKPHPRPEHGDPARYGVALVAVGGAILLRLVAAPWFVQDSPYVFFFAAVMVSAWYGGAGPGLLATALAAVASDFFFIEPLWAFGDYGRRQAVSFVRFGFEGGVISLLGGAMHAARRRAEVAAEGERQAHAEAEAARADLARAYEKQRRIAETLQRSLLRQIPEGRFPGLDVAAIYEAALDEARVGGDFYDAFPLEDGRRVALVIGDVSGKGLAAAERTAEARHALRLLLHHDSAPDRALRSLNEFLCGAACDSAAASSCLVGAGEPALRFIVLSVAVLDPDTGECLLASAGAEPPLLARAASADVEEVDTAGHGLPAGVDADAEYTTTRLRLEAGDMLLLFTDGLTEARRPGARGAFLDHDGLREVVRAVTTEAPQAPAVVTARRVSERVRAFAGGTLSDDACLLVALRR